MFRTTLKALNFLILCLIPVLFLSGSSLRINEEKQTLINKRATVALFSPTSLPHLHSKLTLNETNDFKPLKQKPQDFDHGLVITGSTRNRMILFSFDDGPDIENTPKLLDTLDELGIKALFFLTAERIDGHGSRKQKRLDIAKDILKRGHLLGNHTWTHPQLPLLNNKNIQRQIEQSQSIFKKHLGITPSLLRPPGGARSARTDRIIETKGFTQVLWNLGTGDFQVTTAQQVFQTWKRVFQRRQKEHGENGGIILLHDTHPWSVEAVPHIVSYLRDANCKLLEQGKELYDIVSDPSLFYMNRGQADFGTATPKIEVPPELLSQRQQLLRKQTKQHCKKLASNHL